MDELVTRFEHEWLHGDRELARQTAREYVAAHDSRLVTTFEAHSLADLVALVEQHRAAGRDEERAVADMWLLARFEQQHVTGAIHIGPVMPVGSVRAASR